MNKPVLVHKNATMEIEICPWNLPRVHSRDCPNHPNGIIICTFSFVESPIICCENFVAFACLSIGFIPVCRIGLVGNFVINIPGCILRFRCIFLGVHVLSDFLRHSDNCGYLLPSAFAFTTPIAYPPSPQCFESMDVKTELMFSRVLGEAYTAKGSPRSLAIWGLGGSLYH